MNFTQKLKDEYNKLYMTCKINSNLYHMIDLLISKIITHKEEYEIVEKVTKVPWYVIATIHCMEAGLKFTCHLHNGDPLTARTKRVPKNRPKLGKPPFSWTESAIDALCHQDLDAWHDWTLEGILYILEGYNGWGYRTYHSHVKSPYLWAGSQHYIKGKYTADGKWSEEAVSKQLGAVLLLKRMEDRKIISLYSQISPVMPIFRYSTNKVKDAEKLQKFLNKFLDIPYEKLKEDGYPGKKTSDIFKRFFGHYLVGDPRNPT